MNSKQIIFIVGPTAVGKSDVALDVAKKINGEIVSCDSMQIYKEIDIASNTPEQEVLDQIPHHLVNVISVAEDFDVARFNKLALEAIKDIHLRGRTPVIVGGSGLYMQILLDGLFVGSPKAGELRVKLEEEIARVGNDKMYERLKEQDPDAASKIHVNDTKRIVRALEVCALLGEPFSKVQKNREGLWGKYDIKLFALNMDREKLYERINARVDQMIDQGLVDEIDAIKDLPLSHTAARLIGVKEILGYLNEEYDLDRAAYLMKLSTRHYAKRQLTWFRKEERLKWFELTDNNSRAIVAGKIAKEIL